MVLCHAIPHYSAGLSKVSGISVHPDGALVFTTDHNAGCANDPDTDTQELEQVL